MLLVSVLRPKWGWRAVPVFGRGDRPLHLFLFPLSSCFVFIIRHRLFDVVQDSHQESVVFPKLIHLCIMATPATSATMATSRRILLRTSSPYGAATQGASAGWWSLVSSSSSSSFPSGTTGTESGNQARFYHVLIKSGSPSSSSSSSSVSPNSYSMQWQASSASFPLQAFPPNTEAPTSSTISHRMFSSGKKRDFYEILGVDKKADKASIKKAYFKLAKQYHPDTNKVRVFRRKCLQSRIVESGRDFENGNLS